ncbi:MAG TPA: MotE family protein [Phenylobacterium sp.]
MNRLPRILPLVGVAVGGVLAINALAGAQSLPDLISGARAWAEDAAKPAAKPAKGKAGAKAKPGDKAAGDKAAPADPDAIAPAVLGQPSAATGQPADAAANASALPPPATPPRPVCAPTAAELAKEAGLSPAELQVLQNLGARRGQLDQREQDLSTQLALLAAAEAKVDAKMKALTGLRIDVKLLLDQANGREAAEVDRLVKVFEGMKPKDAAARMAILDDAVRLPIAAKMKERALSAILGLMPPTDAKKLTESLAKRFGAAQILAQNEAKTEAAATVAPLPAAADPNAKPAAPKAKAAPRQAKKTPRKTAPADAQAAATPPAAAAAPAAAAPAPTKAAAAAAPIAPAATPPAKAG